MVPGGPLVSSYQALVGRPAATSNDRPVSSASGVEDLETVVASAPTSGWDKGERGAAPALPVPP